MKKRHVRAIAEAVKGAFSIAFDGCHKIYIHMDQAAHETAVGYGYDPILVTDPDEAASTLKRWYEGSCSLRFINAVSTVDGDPNDGYKDVISQFD